MYKDMHMKKIMITVAFLLCHWIAAQSQVKIGDNPNSISPGSLLELESTSKALTLPRMSTVQMESIASPIPGMIVFNTDSNCIYLYKNNNAWASIIPASPDNSLQQATWPYKSNDGVVGAPGNAKGIVSITGGGLQATGAYSHAEGLNSVATGLYSWSAGFADTVTSTAATAFGQQNYASGPYSFSAGSKNIAAGQSSVSIGQENADSGWASMAMGLQNTIGSQASYSHALGYNNKVLAGWSGLVLGENNQLRSGRANVLTGKGNGSDGNYNLLSGLNNNVQSGNANLIGGEGNQLKSGNNNMLAGINNTAEGSNLGAIGRENIVYFQSGVALGQSNKDSGYASIAAGMGNVIEKNTQFSFAAGQNNLQSCNMELLNTIPGMGTFSAGLSNFNSGNGSVAFGIQNKTTNVASLAANYNTIANSYGMSAFGHFNDTTSAYPGQSLAGQEMLFTIGNGNNGNNRRNSFTMLRNGFTAINATTENGPSLPRSELDVKGTGAIIVPVGSQAERPATPVTGMIRFCTDCPGGPVLQGYNGSEWVNL